MWKPIDTRFHAPKLPVTIIALPESTEVHALRSFLEMLNCVVFVHHIGTPQDFLQVIDQAQHVAPFVIIAGHGSKKGLYFGEFLPTIDISMLVDEYMPPQVIQQHNTLYDCAIIALTCDSGDQAFAQAFQKGNNVVYIGCDGQPDAAATLLFAAHLFFQIQQKGMGIHEAWLNAVKVLDHADIKRFAFFHADKTREVFPA